MEVIVTIVSKLAYNLLRGRIQPTYKGAIIHWLSTMDIQVPHDGGVAYPLHTGCFVVIFVIQEAAIPSSSCSKADKNEDTENGLNRWQRKNNKKTQREIWEATKQTANDTNALIIPLLMAEISNNHLGCIKPYK